MEPNDALPHDVRRALEFELWHLRRNREKMCVAVQRALNTPDESAHPGHDMTVPQLYTTPLTGTCVYSWLRTGARC